MHMLGLRQCIRPLMQPRAPGQDELRCMSVLTSPSVAEDHYRYRELYLSPTNTTDSCPVAIWSCSGRSLECIAECAL